MIIPLFAGFERVPDSLVEASADLGASTGRTVRSVILPLVFPAIAAGSIFTFSLTLGDYIAVTIVGGKTQLLGNLIYGQLVTANNQPLAAAAVDRAAGRDHAVPARHAAHRRIGEHLMELLSFSRALPHLLRVCMWIGLAILYIPLILIVVNSFNQSKTFSFPPTGLTLQWWIAASHSRAPSEPWAPPSPRGWARRSSPCCSERWPPSPCSATASSAGRRSASWWCCRSPSPGSSPASPCWRRSRTSWARWAWGSGIGTVIIGHATFCIVIVFNNVQARLRRLGTSLEEASADLGGTLWQTFRYVTFPSIRGALVAGALLAFALSFDEIVVTTFTAGPEVQTLPIWIFGNLFRPNQAPVVNVVAAVLTIVAIVPVWLSQRIAGDSVTSRV